MTSMKRVFTLFFLLFVALYVVAEATLERPKRDGIVHLRWATDDNPARKVQTAEFAKLFPGKQATVDPGLGRGRRTAPALAAGAVAVAGVGRRFEELEAHGAAQAAASQARRVSHGRRAAAGRFA